MTKRLPQIFLGIRVVATMMITMSAVRDLIDGASDPIHRIIATVATYVCMAACVWWPRIGALLALPIAIMSLAVEQYSYLAQTAPLAIFATLVVRRYWYALAVALTGFGVGLTIWIMPPHREEAFWILSVFMLTSAGLGASVAYMLWTQQRVERLARAELQLHQFNAGESGATRPRDPRPDRAGARGFVQNCGAPFVRRRSRACRRL